MFTLENKTKDCYFILNLYKTMCLCGYISFFYLVTFSKNDVIKQSG